jgi:RNA polymerase sigma-70 factor
VTSPSLAKVERALNDCTPDMNALHARCTEATPNYEVSIDAFKSALRMAVDKYLVAKSNGVAPTSGEIRQFLSEIQASDLFLALACASGNENAWWDFDQVYRPYIERIARHLSSAETHADEVIDFVYVELYGTRVVADVRQSKFASYTGRGTLRGWLRTVVWHAVIDMHRARHDEISIDDWSESGGETHDRPGWRAEARGGEGVMLDRIARERFQAATVDALDASFAKLDDHEKLLLLYYHVENLKLREIARLVEEPASPLRRWFQRQSRRRVKSPESRVHESTVMRWLERVYGKILECFRTHLIEKNRLTSDEVEMCVELATEDMASEDVRRHLTDTSAENIGKGHAD